MPDKPDVEDWMADESEMDQVLPAPTKPTGTQIKLPILLNPQYYPRANGIKRASFFLSYFFVFFSFGA